MTRRYILVWIVGISINMASPITTVGQTFNDLLLFHPKSWEPVNKPLDYFYNTGEIKLNAANDTLDIYILGHKKVSYRWHEVARQMDFNGWFGFENDIDTLLVKIEQLGLDFQRNNYHVIFSPESGELRTIIRPESRFARIGDELLPIFRHQITLTYYSYLMEVDFFLGEIDELEVLKDAGINELVRSVALENNWSSDYRKRNLNKALTIHENGSMSVDTFVSREYPYYPRTNLDVGAAYLFGNSVSFMLQPRFNVRLRNKKTNPVNQMLFFTINGYLSHLDQNGEQFKVAQDYFLGVGFETDQLGNNLSLAWGYRIFGQSGMFGENPLVFKADFSITPRLKVFQSMFFGFGGNNNLANLLGVSFMIY